jgi:hypothetical protein
MTRDHADRLVHLSVHLTFFSLNPYISAGWRKRRLTRG